MGPPSPPTTSGHAAPPARSSPRRPRRPRAPFSWPSRQRPTTAMTGCSVSTSRAGSPPRTRPPSPQPSRWPTVSRSMTMGLGLMDLDVAELAAAGATLDELAARVDALISRTFVFGLVDTLEHLEKGGRIGGARALLGSLLSIKPVVTLVDGVVAEESKQRTRGRSMRYLADKVRDSPPLSRLAVCNGAATDIDLFLEMIEEVHTEHPLVLTDLGPVVGTHTGPGTIGVCMVTAG